MSIQKDFLLLTRERLTAAQKSAEAAMEQLSTQQLFQAPAAGSNSIATIIRHMAGNMRSRWTNFLDTDGEKSWRNRDQEFEAREMSRAALLQEWMTGWTCFLSALSDLGPDDLDREVTIRGEKLIVFDAIQRQVMHYSYHNGQIIYIAKWLAGDKWKALTIPLGKSEDYNRQQTAGKGRPNKEQQ